MSSRKETLIQSQKNIKDSLENQISELQENFTEIGKNALLIGGSLAGVYALIRLINGKDKKKKNAQTQKPVNAKVSPKRKIRKKEPLLSSAAKEQAIVFLLGIATQKLSKFLTELKTEEESDGVK